MIRTLVIAVGSLLLGLVGLFLVVRRDLFEPASYSTFVWNPKLMALALASLVVVWAAPSRRLPILSRTQGSKLPFHLALAVHVAGIFGAAITPGNSGGAPLMAIALNRLGIPLGQGISIAVQTVVLDLVFFAWSVPISLLYLLVSKQLQLPITTRFLSLAFVALLILLALALRYRPRTMVRLFLWMTKVRFLRRYRRGVQKAARDYYRSARRFNLTLWQDWLALHMLTALGWLGLFTLFWTLLGLFGNQVRPLAMIALMDLISLVGSFVPTPGGTGFMEAVVGLSTRAQAGAVSVAAPVIVWRLVTFYGVFLLGPLATGLILVAHRTKESQDLGGIEEA